MTKYTLVAVALFIAGSYIFGMSLHNIDLATNMRYGAVDTNGWGFSQNQLTMYLNGLSGLVMSWIFFYVSVLIVLVEVLVKHEQTL